MHLQIPETILKHPDRNAMFQEIRKFMDSQPGGSALKMSELLPSGAPEVDRILEGGYAVGKITEIVEAVAGGGAQSLIHASIKRARLQPAYVTLIDAFHQFDPQSEQPCMLESLLWVRCQKHSDAVQACDILIRDGNFSQVILDLRNRGRRPFRTIPPSAWYRFQRACASSRMTLTVFTDRSQIPCAYQRIRLSTQLPLALLDRSWESPLSHIRCELLKGQTWSEGEAMSPLKLAVHA